MSRNAGFTDQVGALRSQEGQARHLGLPRHRPEALCTCSLAHIRRSGIQAGLSTTGTWSDLLFWIFWGDFQVVELDFLYPSEGIHRRWDSGYRITGHGCHLGPGSLCAQHPAAPPRGRSAGDPAHLRLPQHACGRCHTAPWPPSRLSRPHFKLAAPASCCSPSLLCPLVWLGPLSLLDATGSKSGALVVLR